MTTAAYNQIIAAAPRDRLDRLLATANRFGAPIGNVEKDFWVCWTFNSRYQERPAGGPRLLFKGGGTSLSKAYGFIQRFSEDIDITVFRRPQRAGVGRGTGALSNKKRRAKLDAIRDACRAYIKGRLLGAQLADATGGAGRVEIDEADPDGQASVRVVS